MTSVLTDTLISILDDSAQAITACSREHANLYQWRARGALHLWKMAASEQELATQQARVQAAMLRVAPCYVD